VSNEESVRKPCLHCGEPASLAARICPHCSNSLLVDVRLERGPADPRQGYQLARVLSRQVPSASFLELKQVLASPAPTVLRGVTREVAETALGICAEYGLEGRSEIAAKAKTSTLSLPALPPKWVAAGVALILVAVLGLWALPSGEEDTAAGEGESAATLLTTEQIVDAAAPSTVSLTCGQSVGSGFFVAADTVLTNAHVLCAEGDSVQVHFPDGRELAGSVRQRDADVDLAIVHVPGANAVPLTLADATGLRTGERIVVIGTPLGMAQTVHEGIVSHFGRNLFGVSYIQVDANVNPGNSGGPLLNQRGEVVGVVSMKNAAGEGLGFALPINYAYAAETPLVHASIPVSAEWRQVVARTAEEEAREVERLRNAFRQPGLVHVVPMQHGLVVVIILRSTFRPNSNDYRAYLEVDGTEECRGDVRISGWGAVAAQAEQVGENATLELSWLKKHGIADDLWYGAGQFYPSTCPDALRIGGADLVLESGEEGYDRMPTKVH